MTAAREPEEALHERWWQALRRNPSAALLGIQLFSILLYPFLDETSDGVTRSGLALLGILVLLLAMRMVVRTAFTTWIAALVGVPALVLTVVDAVTGLAQPWHFWSDVFHFLFYAFAAVGLIIYMVTDDHITRDEFFAVGATFTVGVWAWAYLYSAVQTVQPGSFVAAMNPDEPRTWMELLFLSCTTMTSTGLSDVVPVMPFARAVVMLEQIAGMLYIAMVISRLVALAMPGRRLRPSPEPSEKKN